MNMAIARSADSSQVNTALSTAVIATDQEQRKAAVNRRGNSGESTAGPPQNMIAFKLHSVADRLPAASPARREAFLAFLAEFFARWLNAACADRALSSSFLRFFRSPPDSGIGMTRGDMMETDHLAPDLSPSRMVSRNTSRSFSGAKISR